MLVRICKILMYILMTMLDRRFGVFLIEVHVIGCARGSLCFVVLLFVACSLPSGFSCLALSVLSVLSFSLSLFLSRPQHAASASVKG